MKIVKLQAENVKKLKAITIKPKDNTVIISGPNAAGKTSAIDCISLALSGTSTKKVPEPIRHGEDYAQILLDLDEFTVTKKWTSGKSPSLKVENKTGAVFKSPQAMLDDLYGKFSFDPLEFNNLSDKEQLNTLLELLNLPGTISELDNRRKELYDTRTLVNREIKRLEGQRDGYPPMIGVPDEEINISKIMADYQTVSDILATNQRRRDALKSKEERRTRLNEEFNRIQIELAQLNDEIEVEKTKMDDMLVEPSLDAVKQTLIDAQEKNKLIKKKQELNSIIERLGREKIKSSQITKDIQQVDNDKAEILSNAQMPINGLGFDDSQILYQGIPLKQASSAEQLKVSMAVAMSMNPTIRVIRITDGSLLDSKNMELIKQMASDNDFQVWMEVVDETGKVGIYIEDGEIKEVN